MLKTQLPHLDRLTIPTTNNRDMNAALEFLRTKIVSQDEDVIEGVRMQAPVNIDDALKVLVLNSTEEFGFAPRDVYCVVLLPHKTKMDHINALVNLNLNALSDLARTFTSTCGLNDLSHHVVAVEPHQLYYNYDSWTINFKSVRIAERMVEWMQVQEDAHLRDMYGLLRDFSALAGRIFEAIIHRKFSGGWPDEDMPYPIRMVSDGRNPPTFVEPCPTAAPLDATPLSNKPKTITRINFHRLSHVNLDNDHYYIPSTPPHPLFDSFTVDFTPDGRNAMVCVFRITTSATHQESSKGYLKIRKIMSHLRKAKNVNTIHVAYFLVCPDTVAFPPARSQNHRPQHQWQWQMPLDWDENTQINDHRGHVHSLRVPGFVGQSCDLAE